MHGLVENDSSTQVDGYNSTSTSISPVLLALVRLARVDGLRIYMDCAYECLAQCTKCYEVQTLEATGWPVRDALLSYECYCGQYKSICAFYRRCIQMLQRVV